MGIKVSGITSSGRFLSTIPPTAPNIGLVSYALSPGSITENPSTVSINNTMPGDLLFLAVSYNSADPGVLPGWTLMHTRSGLLSGSNWKLYTKPATGVTSEVTAPGWLKMLFAVRGATGYSNGASTYMASSTSVSTLAVNPGAVGSYGIVVGFDRTESNTINLPDGWTKVYGSPANYRNYFTPILGYNPASASGIMSRASSVYGFDVLTLKPTV